MAAKPIIVLVHGFWHGGWCWKNVASYLGSKGYEVYTPTLTGMGERSHLLSRDIDLSTHIQDVVQSITFENLKDVILVGHSYAGMVLGGVAEATHDRISRLIYLDAMLPEHGATGFDMLPDVADVFRELAARNGDGWLVPPFAPEQLGVTAPEAATWLAARLVPAPIATHEQAMELPEGKHHEIPSAFIRCSMFPKFKDLAEKAKTSGMDYFELECGHDAMVVLPQELADIILRFAGT